MSYQSLKTEDATYWASGTPDGYGGFTYASPVALKVRWQDQQERLVDSDGKEFVSRAIIYTDSKLDKNGWIYRGTSAAATPAADSYVIRTTQRSQNPSGSIVVHKVVL